MCNVSMWMAPGSWWTGKRTGDVMWLGIISVLPEISKGAMVADMVAIIGSLDIVLGEVDR